LRPASRRAAAGTADGTLAGLSALLGGRLQVPLPGQPGSPMGGLAPRRPARRQ